MTNREYYAIDAQADALLSSHSVVVSDRATVAGTGYRTLLQVITACSLLAGPILAGEVVYGGASNAAVGDPGLTFDPATGLVVRRNGVKDGIRITGRDGGALAYDISLTPATLAADYVQTLQAQNGTLALLEVAQTFTAQQTIQAAGGIVTLQASTQDAMSLVGRAGGSSSYVHTQTPAVLTASRTVTWPDATGIPAISAAALTSGRITRGTTNGLVFDSANLLFTDATGLTADVTNGATVTAARLYSTGMTNGQKVYTVMGKGSSGADGFYFAYNHDTTLASRYLSIQENAYGALSTRSFVGWASGAWSYGTATDPGAANFTITGTTNLVGNVAQTGVTTLSTGTGAISLNGDVTIATGKRLFFAGPNSATMIHIDPVATGTSGVNQYGFLNGFTSSTAGTTSTIGFTSSPNTSVNAYTTAILAGFAAHRGGNTPGAGSTITRTAAYMARTITSGGTGNGVFVANTGDLLTMTGNWGVYLDIALSNYLGTGATLINTTTDAGTDKLQIFGSSLVRAASTQDGVRVQGRAGGSSSYIATITPTTLTASRTWTIPDRDDTFAGLGVQTFTGVQTFSANIVQTGATTWSSGTGAVSLNGIVTASLGSYSTGGSNPAATTTAVFARVTSGVPYLNFIRSASAVDNRIWDNFVSASALEFRAVNDAYGVATNWLTVTRSGTAISSIAFGGAVSVSSTTDAISHITGSLTTLGGISYPATKTLYGGIAYFAGLITADGGLTLGSGDVLQLGNAAAVGAALVSTHTVTIKDSTGTTYRLMALV